LTAGGICWALAWDRALAERVRRDAASATAERMRVWMRGKGSNSWTAIVGAYKTRAESKCTLPLKERTKTKYRGPSPFDFAQGQDPDFIGKEDDCLMGRKMTTS
jgi:hypothetical protein